MHHATRHEGRFLNSRRERGRPRNFQGFAGDTLDRSPIPVVWLPVFTRFFTSFSPPVITRSTGERSSPGNTHSAASRKRTYFMETGNTYYGTSVSDETTIRDTMTPR